ncbi:Lsr2 family protein [Kitasatospora cineracea]|uniref:histone-like nucleoid-structuring protein Lsr2 n=1 Tax=Kitasatospora cineracea TaxID=88074 RepID=UPI0033D91CB9
MVQRVQVTLEDDLTGGKADETVHFALDGKSYEIDLGTKNAKKLRDALAPFVAAGRKQSGRVQARRFGRAAAASGEDTAKIREWAKQNGYEINDRGRVPGNVREAYEAAH